MRRARWAVLVCGLWGCGPGTSAGDPDPDAVPIHVKDTPGSKTGNESSPGCNGVTERGECKDGRAITCDLTRDKVNTIDCVAIGRTCVSDVNRGASCEMVPTSGGGGADGGNDEETTCASGVTLAGFCAGTTAIWCATSTGETVTWDCAMDGLACKVDDCGYGAYCCAQSGMMPPMMTSECDRLGLAGECASGVARWCAAGTIQEVNCASEGKTCEVDTCAFGAYCCGGPAMNECDTLGLRGECGGTGGNTARWCSGSTLIETDCATSTNGVCLVDVCGTGASCCSCEALGEEGRCAGNTVWWCDGTTIRHEDCAASGQTCKVNTCGNGAYCCN